MALEDELFVRGKMRGCWFVAVRPCQIKMRQVLKCYEYGEVGKIPDIDVDDDLFMALNGLAAKAMPAIQFCRSEEIARGLGAEILAKQEEIWADDKPYKPGQLMIVMQDLLAAQAQTNSLLTNMQTGKGARG